VLIHKAGETDLAGAAQVLIDTWRSTFRGIVPDDFLDGLSYPDAEARLRRRLESATHGDCMYVAEADDGQIVGLATGGKSRFDLAPFSGEVRALYVLPSHQRQGLGKSLIHELVTNLARDGFSSVVICVLRENTNARRFYETIGGQPAEERLINVGGRDLDEITYLWPDISSLIACTSRPSLALPSEYW